MFRIADGREHFYQWDLDRQIIVEDASIVEVHFCNRTDDCSLVVEVVDGLANVPNVILQKNFDVRVFGYDGKATRYDEVFKVKARTKPTDYVYTEVEIKRYEDLEKRITEIELGGISEETVTNAVNKYLEENPVNLDGYATETYVDNAIANIDIPEVDLSKHALKSEIPTKVSQLQNDSKFITRVPDEYITETELNAKGYATEKYVDNAIANAEIPEGSVNLTNYYTKTETDELVANINECDTYFFDPRDLIFDKGFNNNYAMLPESLREFSERLLAGTEVDLVVYDEILGRYTPSEIQVVGTNIYVQRCLSAYDIDKTVNVKQWLFTHQASLGGWVTCVQEEKQFSLSSTSYVDEAIANIELPEGGGGNVDLSNYATKAEIPTKVSQLTNDSKYITLAEVPTTDLSEYAKKNEIPTKVSALTNDAGYLTQHQDLSEYAKKSEIPDVSDFITSIPSEYITESELNAKGYLTEHQSLAGYATEKYVDDAIANIEIPEGTGSGGSVSNTEYIHRIALGYVNCAAGGYNAYNVANVEVINNSATPLTATAFASYLTENGHTSKDKYLPSCGGRLNRANASVGSTSSVNNGGFGEVIGIYLDLFSIKVVYVNSAGDSSGVPTGGLAVDSLYSVYGEERPSDTSYQYFNDVVKVHTFKASGGGTSGGESGGESVDLTNYYTKSEVDALIPEAADLSGYYTKDETNQAIQDALSAIGVAEGGAY